MQPFEQQSLAPAGAPSAAENTVPYMYALYVCLICMPYMYALYVCLICMPYMYALYVCLICMHYMYAFHVLLRHLLERIHSMFRERIPS